MTKWNQAILEDGSEFGAMGPIANVLEGGNYGAGPQATRLDASSALVLNNVIIILLSAPSMWDMYPRRQQFLKNMFENLALSVSGIPLNYRLNSNETPYSHDGQMQAMPTNSQRDAVQPSFTYPELTGNVIWNIHRQWIFDIQHPDTQVSAMSSTRGEDQIPNWVMSSITASFAVIQPDPTGIPSKIIDGAIITNVFPQETGELGWKKEINGSPESPQRNITYKGLIHHNDTTRRTCVEIMQLLNFHKPNMSKAANYNEVDSTIRNYGMSQQLENMLNQMSV